MIYTIKCIKENITVFSYIDGEFERLKNNGEKSQNFQEEIFWRWFEEKISYDDEAISFIIITDKKEFKIPNHFKLNNSFKLDNNLKNFINRYLENYFLLTKPNIDIPLETLKADKITEKKVSQEIKKGSISEYFINKTKSYKNL
jgi:hypothetical protein